MTPFLQQVAKHYLEAQGLEDYCFVFPNRRSGQFFTHYLQQEFVDADTSAGKIKPHLMPCVTSINELVSRLTGTVTATDIEMMFALYDAYCKAMGDKAQEFDKFIYWAQLIISDFNDIDRSLADAHEIYQNLDDIHGLSSNYISDKVKEEVKRIFGDSLFTAFFDTSADADLWQHRSEKNAAADKKNKDQVRQEFVSLWNALETIYHYYHEALEQKKVVSPGRQLRLAVEGDLRPIQYSKLVFVGFGVLSAAEVKLFQRFGETAEFWWDNAGIKTLLKKAPHDPGALLIDGYCKRFKAFELEPLEDNGQTLRVVSVPSSVGQAKLAFQELERMEEGKQGSSLGIDTAIVLPDENLLVPLLHSVPADRHRLNVTLGYSLRSSGIVSLMHIVARMHHQASKEKGQWTYYREDVNDILSHPLIKTYFTQEALNLATELARTNRFRVPAREFEPMSFKDLFVPSMDSDNTGNDQSKQADYLDNLLSFCNLLMDRMAVEEADDDDKKTSVELPLQQAFLVMYIDVLNQLRHALEGYGQPLQRSTVFYLIDRLASSAIVPFTGEPLQGLQVMGLLETRSLDFKNLVVLSMNERVFPRRRSINSFIPNYIRRAHGMSTTEQQEAIVAFNFYRLLNRASHVTLIYDSSVQSMGSSEPSRYIAQLEKIYARKIEYVEMTPHVKTSSSINISVPNGDDIALEDLYTRDPLQEQGRYLSASAINKYINCPLMFYMHYVQDLNEDNEVSDFMDYGTFGNIIHDTLKDCYDCEEPRVVNKAYIEFFKKNKLDRTVEYYIKKHYLHVPEDQLESNREPLRGEAFMLVDTIKSYVNFVLKYDAELMEKQQDKCITILECEKTHIHAQLKMGNMAFNFKYKPDRIDCLANGTVRIVDYKTGRDEVSFSPDRNLYDLFDKKKDRCKAILQLFLYSYAYLLEHPEVKSVMPVIYKLSSMQDSGVKIKRGRGVSEQYVFTLDDVVAQEFISRMASTVHSLYNDEFVQVDEDAPACNYCRFVDFCRRTPSKPF